MRRLCYGFSVSLDGFIAGPGQDIGWSRPDAELHEYYNAEAAETGTSLYGRRLYQLMNGFWPTADQDPDASPQVVEFARIWRGVPKVVFSRTLTEVDGNARLATGDLVEEVGRLKAQTGGKIDVGGAGLAAELIRRGLVDEFQMVVFPVVLGGGTPFFPAMTARLDLTLVETRTFGSGVVLLRHRPTNGGSTG
jgi:dihydrofolate reductase